MVAVTVGDVRIRNISDPDDRRHFINAVRIELSGDILHYFVLKIEMPPIDDRTIDENADVPAGMGQHDYLAQIGIGAQPVDAAASIFRLIDFARRIHPPKISLSRS